MMRVLQMALLLVGLMSKNDDNIGGGDSGVTMEMRVVTGLGIIMMKMLVLV